MQQVIHILLWCNTEPIQPTLWKAPLVGAIHILENGVDPILRNMAVHAVWAELAKDRSGYDGLQPGIDHINGHFDLRAHP